MNGAAVAAIIAVAIVAVGGGAAYAMGVFDKDGGSEGDDDWTDHIGEYTTYETRGTIERFMQKTSWTGTATNTLLYMDEDTGYWFINYYSEYSYPYDPETYVHDSNQWGMSEDYEEKVEEETPVDTKYFGTKTCTHVVLSNKVTGHTEDQYVGVDDGITYYVVAVTVSGAGLNKVVQTTYMDYVGEGKKKVDIDFDVTLFADGDIEVSGAGTYVVGKSVTVTATGGNFFGWYDFNVSADTPITTERSYTFNITRDTSLYALTGAADKSYESGKPVTLQSGKDLVDATWTITMYDRTIGEEVSTDSIDGASPTYTFDVPGDYRITIMGTTSSGEVYNGYRALYVDGDLTNTYELKVGNVTETMELSILFSDYVEYMDKMDISERKDIPDDREKHYSEFVKADTVYIKQVAEYFLNLQEKYSLTDIELAAAVLSLTQYIPYELDSDTHRVSEYWNYPVETLYLKKGDCEDGSILCSAIFKALGFKSCLILMSGHMAVGFLGTDMKGFDDWTSPDNPFTPNGYYYGETTSTSYKLGEIPRDSRGRISVTFIAEIQISTGYDEDSRSNRGPPGPLQTLSLAFLLRRTCPRGTPGARSGPSMRCP